MFEVVGGSDCDGCTDIPTALRYRELDEKFPNSKFIFTIRDKEKWLESVRKHFHRRPASTLGSWGKENRKALYGSLIASECDFEGVYDRHHAEVLEYFKDRPEADLLVLDVCSGEGWSKLCTFLGCEAPIMPFPHGNAAPESDPAVDVVYPYATGGAQWEELRYSIRSVEENFLNLRNIWLIGDQPDWISEIYTIPKNRPYPDTDLKRNYDYTQSILWAAINPNISDPFLLVNDDHYLLSPMTANDIANRPMIRENMDNYTQEERDTGDKAWQKVLWGQYDRNKSFGLGGWNFEAHTPCIVTKQCIVETWSLFGFGDGKLIWKTAYYNLFPPACGEGHLSEVSGHKAGFYGDKEETPKSIDEKTGTAIYLNHNDDGLTDDLKMYLACRFGTPSKYEKLKPYK